MLNLQVPVMKKLKKKKRKKSFSEMRGIKLNKMPSLMTGYSPGSSSNFILF